MKEPTLITYISIDNIRKVRSKSNPRSVGEVDKASLYGAQGPEFQPHSVISTASQCPGGVPKLDACEFKQRGVVD